MLTAAATVTDIGFYGSAILVLCGAAADYYYSNDDGATWQQPVTASTLNTPRYMAVSSNVPNHGIVLLAYLPNILRTSSQLAQVSPVIGPATRVHDDNVNITGIDLVFGQIVVYKTNGVFLVDLAAGTEEPLIDAGQSSFDATRAASRFWPGANSLFFRRGAQMYRFSGDRKSVV